MYGSIFSTLTLSWRASSTAPKDAVRMPLPKEDTTPPVTNTNRGHRPALGQAAALREALD